MSFEAYAGLPSPAKPSLPSGLEAQRTNSACKLRTFAVANSVDRDAHLATASFEVGVEVQVMRGFSLRFRQRHAEFRCDFRDQFHGQFKVIQHVRPEVQSASDAKAAAEVEDVVMAENATFSMSFFPPRIREIDVHSVERSILDSFAFVGDREQRRGVARQHFRVGSFAFGQPGGSVSGVFASDFDPEVVVFGTTIGFGLNEQPFAAADLNF